jgi:hypothetical protein
LQHVHTIGQPLFRLTAVLWCENSQVAGRADGSFVGRLVREELA